MAVRFFLAVRGEKSGGFVRETPRRGAQRHLIGMVERMQRAKRVANPRWECENRGKRTAVAVRFFLASRVRNSIFFIGQVCAILMASDMLALRAERN